AASIRPQQRAFDGFRRVYNFERPHHSLQMHTPGEVYSTSRNRYPKQLLGPHRSEAVAGHLEMVDRAGFIKWGRDRIFISQVLAYELVTLVPGEDSRWNVLFGSIPLGWFD